jgi:GTPase
VTTNPDPHPTTTMPDAAAEQAAEGPAPAAGRLPRVAVVGRPNVGKSTLVNRILGRRAAITQEQPGVTRDRVVYQAEWSGRRFEVVDTGGWEARARGLAARVAEQAELAMAEADLILLVVDVQVGVTAEDADVAERLRRADVPVLLVANKADDAARELDAGALWTLGLGEPHPVSSLHGRGSGDLLDEITARLPDAPRDPDARAGPPAVALVGRPNVGKSSLLNRLAGTELALVDPAPGTTRDTVDQVLEAGGRAYRFVDTAGIRRAFTRAQGADYYALVRSLEAVRRADVAVLLLDAPQGVADQDQKIAAAAVEAGCGLIVAANKWDLIDDDTRRQLADDLERKLFFVDWAPMLRISARTGRSVGKLWGLLDEVIAARGQRIPTAALNQWLEQATARTPPPPAHGRQVKVRYATQPGVNPPNLVLFTTGLLAASYLRYLEHDLRRTFGFAGTPIRLSVRARASRATR